MDVFVARQPIFNRRKEVIGYEILFRDGTVNWYTGVDKSKATCNVITNVFFLIGIDKLTQGKKAFINFTEDLIKNEIGTILPKKSVVIEILEDIEPTYEIISRCKELKKKGYIIALDDFVFYEKYKELLKFIDIVKVDFKSIKGAGRKAIIDCVNNPKIKFLAEKVETMEEFNEAVKYGYDYFQGYFFSKPCVISTKDIPANKLANFQILKELQKKDKVDFNKIENYLKVDMSMLYKFFRMINSSSYGFKTKVTSLKQAMTLLGVKEVYKWVYVITVRQVCEDKHSELLKISLIRAKFCENLAKRLNVSTFMAYVTGLFSTIDVFLGKSMEYIMKDIYIDQEVKDALIGKGNSFNTILEIVKSYEKGHWEDVIFYCKIVGIDTNYVFKSYVKALNWMGELQKPI